MTKTIRPKVYFNQLCSGNFYVNLAGLEEFCEWVRNPNRSVKFQRYNTIESVSSDEIVLRASTFGGEGISYTPREIIVALNQTTTIM